MKLFFLDLETGGIVPDVNPVLQISGIIEVDGEIADVIDLKVKPFEGQTLDDQALEVIGVNRSEIDDYMDPRQAYKILTATLDKYVSKYDKTDKFFVVGYKSDFDDSHLRNWFRRNGDEYYGSYFWWPPIDVATLLMLEAMKTNTRQHFTNFQLMTAAKNCGVEIEEESAHDALYDIAVTRELFWKYYRMGS